MHKEFPVSRVCVIDYYPLLKSSIKETIQMCKKYNIPFVTQGRTSKDIQKFFYHYCLEKICSEYKKCPSSYEKVLAVYPIPKELPFSQKNLDKILSVLPIPWCKVSSWHSPDLELSAFKSLSKPKSPQKTLTFANKHDLHVVLKNIQKNKIFSKGSVDFSGNLE
jgi:hypothetical protein